MSVDWLSHPVHPFIGRSLAVDACTTQHIDRAIGGATGDLAAQRINANASSIARIYLSQFGCRY